jgi:hypothetical protein
MRNSTVEAGDTGSTIPTAEHLIPCLFSFGLHHLSLLCRCPTNADAPAPTFGSVSSLHLCNPASSFNWCSIASRFPRIAHAARSARTHTRNLTTNIIVPTRGPRTAITSAPILISHLSSCTVLDVLPHPSIDTRCCPQARPLTRPENLSPPYV